MKRPDYRNGVIFGARRRALVEELRSACTPISLCAPAGYGKSTFAHMLRASGVTAAVREERRLRPRPARDGSAAVGPEQLAFDGEELARVFGPLSLSAQHFDRSCALAGGWPLAALYLLRLGRLGVLERALGDPSGPAFDDLFEYIEHNVYAPATRTERLALLAGETAFARHPLVRAAVQACHADGARAVLLHRARVSARKGRAMASGDRDAVASLPFAALREDPQVWLQTCGVRLRAAGSIAFAEEAAAVVKTAERQTDTAAYARSSLWLAVAHILNGNAPAALAECERTLGSLPDNFCPELGVLRGALESGMQTLPAQVASLVGVADLVAQAATLAAEHGHAGVADGAAAVRVELFSGRAIAGENEIQLTGREAAVLFTLAAAPRHRASSKKLIDAIWPEIDTDSAHAALKVAITRLRGRLGSPRFVRFAEGKYALHEEIRVDATDLTQALDEYERTGDRQALAGFYGELRKYRPPRLRDAPWFAPIERLLVQLVHRLARALAQFAAAAGDTAAMGRIGTDLLAADGCDEAGCIIVVQAYVLEGRTDAARAEYDRFVQRLKNELACEPSFPFESVAKAPIA